MWEVEMEEIETLLEKIWDIHDKLSDAILSISRSYFLKSIRTPVSKPNTAPPSSSGFVFAKDFRADHNVISEVRSLNCIRSALENLEDQLEFFHTVQMQQRAERDTAIAQLEQSRIVLAMRLTEHTGKKYGVIEEALAFVGDVHDSGRFARPVVSSEIPQNHSFGNMKDHEAKGRSILMQMLVSGFAVAKKSLKLQSLGSLLGNAALLTVSMLALLQLHQGAFRSNYSLDVPDTQRDSCFHLTGNEKSKYQFHCSSGSHANHLDVLSARG